MDNKFVEFFKNNLGFLIGLLVGIIIVIGKVTYVIVNLAIMIGCAILGMYIQKNKQSVKTTLKNIIDKM